MIQMEDGHAQVRRECEMLRMEFEQTLAANEQTGFKISLRQNYKNCHETHSCYNKITSDRLEMAKSE